jgi:hypothetical protein
MPTRNAYRERIERELVTAGEAFQSGNNGKGRVCARRAAGFALTWYLSLHPRQGWGTNAMTQLLKLKDDPLFPQKVRDAAARLTARITEQFSYPFETSPLEDSKIIVSYILGTIGKADD